MAIVKQEGIGLLNERELARFINVSTALVRKWRRRGAGPPYFKLGRLVRYEPTQVMAWLEVQKLDGASSEREVASRRLLVPQSEVNRIADHGCGPHSSDRGHE